MFYIHAPKHYVHRQPIRRPPLELSHRMRMCWAAFALDEESGWDDYLASRKSISSSPSLSISNEPTSATITTATSVVSATQSPTTPTSTSIPGAESHLWTSSTTTFEPVSEWQKEVGATFPSEPVIVDIDDDVDMVMDMDLDIDVSHQVSMTTSTDVMMSTMTTTMTTTTTQTVVTPSEQQEWRKTIDAQVEEGRKQLEMTTIQIERVEEVIKPAKRFIPTKITAYFPSSPALSIPMHLRPSSADIIVSTPRSRRNSLRQLEAGEINEEEEERKQREMLEELARSLSSVSIRTTRTRTQTSTQVVKGKPPPIGIGMMMGFKSVKSESASTSPRLKGKEVDFSMAPTKITKRGVITGARGGAAAKGRGAVMKRRNSGGSYRGETISL
ncbi:hypothetical protein TWF730_000389 [Orbilia blumenaviensis]|uniref:Uncharacterized protein n=1 Tax=Orbilia blumenaviensis TaxID=1796055 RepID=A0AAV9VLM4_9PEZI